MPVIRMWPNCQAYTARSLARRNAASLRAKFEGLRSPRRVVDAGTITFSLRFQLTPELGRWQVLSDGAPGLPRKIVREQFEVFHR
jgi:hypothetical protein